MDSRPLDDELGEFLQALRRRWYVVVAAIVQFAFIAYLLSSIQTPIYQTAATVLVEPSAAQETLDAAATNNNGIRGRSIGNEILFARSGEVLTQLAEQVDATDLDALKKKLSVTGDSESDFLEFVVTDTSATEAAAVANTWAGIYVTQKQQAASLSLLEASTTLQNRLDDLQNLREDLRSDLEGLLAQRANATDQQLARFDARIQAEQTSIAPQDALLEAQIDRAAASLIELSVASDLASSGTARIVTDALPPDEASNIAPARNLAIGILLGGIVGVIVVRRLGRRDDRVSQAIDIESELNLPVLAAVPLPSRAQRKHELALTVAEQPGELIAEAFNQLRASTSFLSQSSGAVLPVLITSATPGEGKTSTASNLALAAANAGARTTLIDLDLRRPRIHSAYSLSQRPGFSDIVSGDFDFESARTTFDGFPLAIVTAGTPTPNPANLVANPAVQEVVEAASFQSDLIIVDTPPVLAVSDATSIAAATDAICILVVRAGRTTLADVRESVKRLERVGSTVAGVVLIGVKTANASGRSYYSSREDRPTTPINLVSIVQRPDRQPSAKRRINNPPGRTASHRPPLSLSQRTQRSPEATPVLGNDSRSGAQSLDEGVPKSSDQNLAEERGAAASGRDGIGSSGSAGSKSAEVLAKKPSQERSTQKPSTQKPSTQKPLAETQSGNSPAKGLGQAERVAPGVDEKRKATRAAIKNEPQRRETTSSDESRSRPAKATGPKPGTKTRPRPENGGGPGGGKRT